MYRDVNIQNTKINMPIVLYRKSSDPQVYNYGSSDWNPLKMAVGYQYVINITRKNPSLKTAWYPFLVCANNIFVFLLIHTLCHVLPSILIDLSLLIRGKKPM